MQVADTTPPRVTIAGGVTLVTLEAGSTFTPPTVTASDTVDGAITTITRTPASIDTRRVGDVTVTFSARDAAGNVGSASLTLRIVDTTPPVLFLNGPASVDQRIDTPYVDSGAYATDNADSTATLQPRITATSTVVVSREGDYTVTYNVQDLSGNTAASIARNVHVSVRDSVVGLTTC